MDKFKKFISALLAVSLLIGNLIIFTVSAEVKYPVSGTVASAKGAQIWSLPGTVGHEVDGKKGESQQIDTLENGTALMVLGEEKDGDGDTWYKVNYGDNYSKIGYAYSGRVKLNIDYEYDENFEVNLANFPSSYHAALRELHAIYPNWQFVANKFDLTFKEAVEAQYSVTNLANTRKWVEFTYGGNEWRDMRGYDPVTDEWATREMRWTFASRVAIEYFMDPRNSLNADKIFVFMKQSYTESEKTRDNLRTVIKGTFLENGYDKNGDGAVEKDAYIDDMISAAEASGVSPYVLAATIIVEQGSKGETNLISGTYPGFEGYYNFFNFSTTGSTKDEMAQSGLSYAKSNGWSSRTASIIGGAKKYADGYISIGQDTYYYKDFNVVKQIWSHQYAAALYDAWTNANYLRRGCTDNKDAVLTFSIPVYADMPENACPYPTPGYTPDPDPEPVVKKGDVNGDANINAIDLAAVKMDILGVKKLSGTEFSAGDVNSNGVINAIDLAAIKMHILGVKSIS